MKKALVTGGSGFLGRYLVKELLKQKIETIIFDSVKPSDNYLEGEDRSLLSYVKGDILDEKQLEMAMDGISHVFHTAAIADIDVAKKIPVKTIEVNVVGTAKCLNSAQKMGVDRFLLASTVYVSGNRGSFYRISKQSCESLCKSFFEETGLNYTILRYGSLYGRESNHWNFIYGVCKSLLTTGTYRYSSSPDAVREYIHISDAARETVRIAEDLSFVNKSVLITGHQRMKMKEFFDMVEEILENKVTVQYEKDLNNSHYVITPYSFDVDVPLRVNLSTYVDISEGILDCLTEVKKELSQKK
jgi:UDP-glucose 4-epimerase